MTVFNGQAIGAYGEAVSGMKCMKQSFSGRVEAAESIPFALFNRKPKVAACLHIPYTGINHTLYETYLCDFVTGGRIIISSLCNDL